MIETDPAIKAAQGVLRRMGEQEDDPILDALAYIIRRETKCDRMRDALERIKAIGHGVVGHHEDKCPACIADKALETKHETT